jgi:hypothetical protein
MDSVPVRYFTGFSSLAKQFSVAAVSLVAALLLTGCAPKRMGPESYEIETFESTGDDRYCASVKRADGTVETMGSEHLARGYVDITLSPENGCSSTPQSEAIPIVDAGVLEKIVQSFVGNISSRLPPPHSTAGFTIYTFRAGGRPLYLVPNDEKATSPWRIDLNEHEWTRDWPQFFESRGLPGRAPPVITTIELDPSITREAVSNAFAATFEHAPISGAERVFFRIESSRFRSIKGALLTRDLSRIHLVTISIPFRKRSTIEIIAHKPQVIVEVPFGMLMLLGSIATGDFHVGL